MPIVTIDTIAALTREQAITWLVANDPQGDFEDLTQAQARDAVFEMLNAGYEDEEQVENLRVYRISQTFGIHHHSGSGCCYLHGGGQN